VEHERSIRKTGNNFSRRENQDTRLEVGRGVEKMSVDGEEMQ